MNGFFGLVAHGTTIRREVLAGVVTFVTMAYIMVVNPSILQAAGIPFGPSVVATIATAVFGTLLMGLYARRPFAIAPYMGENAFVAYTVCGVLGYSWQTALGAIFMGGVLFAVLALIPKARVIMSHAVPAGLKASFAASIGLFIAFIGLVNAGVVTLGVPGAPVHLGDLSGKAVWLALFSLLLIAFLLIRKVRGALLIGIVVTSLLGFVIGVAQAPAQWVSLPPSLAPVFLKLNIPAAFSWGLFGVILSVFTMGFLDTMGTVIGLSANAGLLDKSGNLPEVEKPMLADALATIFGALLGTTISGAYIESAAGIEEGGRTGLTAVVVAFLFLLGLFFFPVFAAVPAAATGPVLVIVGLLMMAPVAKINFQDYTEVIPAFAVMALVVFTYNIGVGLAAGFILYPLCKLVGRRHREMHRALWIPFVLCLLFFVFYPY